MLHRQLLLMTIIVTASLWARAQDATLSTDVSDSADNDIQLQYSTYGTLTLKRANTYKNAQDVNPKRRTRTDLERVIFEPELEFGPSIKLESEIEFEHGGTGTALEYDGLEESGEFEQEVEAGGEVIIEKLELLIENTAETNLRVGYITVPVGLISQRHHPHEYFTVSRNRSEERILPSTWREMGVSVFGTLFNTVHYEVGVFNGLNSEFFRKATWVKEGQRRLFEDMTADDAAIALRVDYGQFFKRSLVGFSLYQGNSANNRRKLDKLKVDANVFIWDVHAFYDSPTWSARALYLRGYLSNADKIQAANATLAGPAAPGAQSPLGSEAEAWFVELGYNIQRLAHLSRRLDLFGRFDSVDPMAATTGDIVRDARFREQGWTVGANWYLKPEIVMKAQYSEFKSGMEEIPTDQEVSLGFGWYFSTEG